MAWSGDEYLHVTSSHHTPVAPATRDWRVCAEINRAFPMIYMYRLTALLCGDKPQVTAELDPALDRPGVHISSSCHDTLAQQHMPAHR